MPELFLLYESAAGYLLAYVHQWETIAEDSPAVQAALQEAARFTQLVRFSAFHPFQNAEEALENMEAIVNGAATPLLLSFLETHLPSNKSSYTLVLADTVLAKHIASHGLPVGYSANAIELLRGCRQHLQRIAKNLAKLDISKFQVGLGHSYSRTKIQFDPKRQDKPIMQSIALIDSLDKNVNKFAMRVREWYGWHFPELGTIITDNKAYCRCLMLIGTRENFSEISQFDELVEACGSDDVAKEIIQAMKVTMGQDITEADLSNIEHFASQVIKLAEQREHLVVFLEAKLKIVAPNLQALIGDTLSARLISHAGSLVNLAKYPASTIQILGAEKALFRALKSKTNTPKYGLLFQSTFIGQAAQPNKGKVSRYLANKCSLAARIDNFTTIQSSIFGEKLKDQVVERMKFLVDHVLPKKNVDVMNEAAIEYQQYLSTIKTEKRKEKKKRKVTKEAASEQIEAETNVLLIDHVEPKPKKLKKRKKIASTEVLPVEEMQPEEPLATIEGSSEMAEITEKLKVKKKKKKSAKENIS
ncbi:putative nucleolar protein [Cardiosporidium cionae]|uniref:Nucleolar protein 56 n=1 Tax=Cardiosporidium cionae TaxID=476202 RepID=A0ABQ7J6I6_9APIC|nr:putative nucleolar protein [Cardiosporidium cionae]|eukprot:KAF8819295.1 putative nucleolar protein [Cardiosporidium cionae]